jgi:hypothetical protein
MVLNSSSRVASVSKTKNRFSSGIDNEKRIPDLERVYKEFKGLQFVLQV